MTDAATATSTVGASLPPVRAERIEALRTRIPLLRPFRTSFGVQHERDVLLVRVRGATADGWGECVAPAAPVYSEEFTDGAALVLRDHLAPALAGDLDALDLDMLDRRTAHLKGHRMARAALECAILDAQLRAAGIALAHHLGAVRTRVPAGVSVGIPAGGAGELIDQIAAYTDQGYVRVKTKIAPGFDIAPMRAVRDHFGDALSLQVDANAGYDADDATHHAVMDGLDELGLTMIEQPFAPDRLSDHATLAARLDTPLCLDESIVDDARAHEALTLGACSIINVKPGRVGGVRSSVRVRDVCMARGVPVWCGGMLETGVGRAVNVAMAALPGFDLPGDVSASDRYFADDITEPFVLVDGHIAVPDTAGIGRTPHETVVEQAAVTTLVAS